MHNVFVYGLLRGDISSPLSRVLDLYSWEYATLPEHKVITAFGLYTVTPSTNTSVWGMVYLQVDDEKLRELDMIEGEGRLYDRVEGLCRTSRWGEIPCLYYRMPYEYIKDVESLRN